MITLPSPNHDARPPGARIDMLILHYTGMPTAAGALDRLCDPAAKVSAHWLVDESGRVHALVDEARRAWHAGVCCWAGRAGLNDVSIGIEIANPGHEWGYRPFPEAQMQAVEILARAILARHPIPPDRVVAHSDVAPERKQDPGELFDWERLAAAGIGLWPGACGGSGEADIRLVQRRLRAFGYCTPQTGRLDDTTGAVLRAFQRRFRPQRIDGRPDGECAARLDRLIALRSRCR